MALTDKCTYHIKNIWLFTQPLSVKDSPQFCAPQTHLINNCPYNSFTVCAKRERFIFINEMQNRERGGNRWLSFFQAKLLPVWNGSLCLMEKPARVFKWKWSPIFYSVSVSVEEFWRCMKQPEAISSFQTVRVSRKPPWFSCLSLPQSQNL